MAHMGCTCGNDMWDGDGHIVFDATEDDYPHREVHFMIKVGEFFCEDKSKKVEI